MLAAVRSSHPQHLPRESIRITGLPVDATAKEIARHADKLKQMEELGYGAKANTAAFALDPPPSIDQIREAMQRLKEPERRLIDEFFWFLAGDVWGKRQRSGNSSAFRRRHGEGLRDLGT